MKKILDTLKKVYVVVREALSKFRKFLTNNKVVRIKESHLILFSKFRIKITRKRRAAFYGLLFISPWIVGYLIFSLYPVINSFYLSLTRSFYNLNDGMQSDYVGFINYINIIRNQEIFPLLIAYVGRMLLSVPLIIVFSLIIALLINQPIKGKGIFRTIFFLPVIISSGPLLNELINQGATTLPSFENSAALSLIADNVGEWLANPIEWILNQLLFILWYAGVPILVFLTSLQKIDPSIYEASQIDGASPWDNFWKITLPSIKPFISVNIIYIVVSMSMFVEQGGILEIARTHMLSGSRDSTRWFGYGYSAAISWIYFILMVLIILLFVGLVSIRRREKEWNPVN